MLLLMIHTPFNPEYYALLTDVIHYLDQTSTPPNVSALAQRFGMSTGHFSRIFKTYIGLTPQQFMHALSFEQTIKTLEHSKSLLACSEDANLSSPSRLHDLFINFTGLTPKEFKAKGHTLTLTHGKGLTPFGPAHIAFSERGVSYLGFYGEGLPDPLEEIYARFPKGLFIEDHPKAQVYFDRIFQHGHTPKLDVRGTNFQINVWRALLAIPEGHLLSYQEIANQLGNPNAVRAVGSAIGANPVSVLIPCHRVIASSGKMGGYHWGLARKRLIIASEIGNHALKNGAQ